VVAAQPGIAADGLRPPLNSSIVGQTGERMRGPHECTERLVVAARPFCRSAIVFGAMGRLLRRGALLLTFLAVGSCGGANSGATTGTVSLCSHPSYLDDAGAGACTLGRAALFCESPTQGGCDCVTNDQSCGCNIPCENKCHANEYAVACGGPPAPPDRDAAPYADPPANCRGVGGFPSGGAFYCCPCE
jgi:hypothetical protein